MNESILNNGQSVNMVAVQWVQIISILLAGLSAGLFYGYDCSVIKGLGNLPDELYLKSFQSINRAILNPYFFLSFMGTLFALPLAAWMSYRADFMYGFYFLLLATLLYAIGVFGVTIAGNVPLNNMLDRIDLSSPGTDLKLIRQQFEANWNRLHHIRTYANILSFLCCILSLIKKA